MRMIYNVKMIDYKKILILLFVAPLAVYSQDIKKDVTVTKAYQPALGEFKKINQMPVFDDTAKIKPRFNYSISSVRSNAPFSLRPVSAAKMLSEQDEELRNGYLKFGIGYPWARQAEILATNTRSKNNLYGILLRHEYINGNIELDNKESVKAPFTENEVTLFGTHLMNDASISGQIGYNGNKFNYYGYNTTLDTIPANPSQHYQSGHIRAAYNTTNRDSNKLIINANGGFRYFTDDYSNSENTFHIEGNGGKLFNSFFVKADVDFRYLKGGSNSNDFYNRVLSIKPSVNKASGEWNFSLGLNMAFEDFNGTSNMQNSPYASIEFNVVPKVLTAYMSLDGYIKQNSWSEMVNENPFITPGFKPYNSNYKTVVTGGIKGSVSNSAMFNLKAVYASVDSQYFYVNDSLGKYFSLAYDKPEMLSIIGEFSGKVSDKLTLSLTSRFNNYSMLKIKKPYHIPVFEGNVAAVYNLRNKIILGGDLNITGNRPVLLNGDKSVNLKTFATVNLNLEYRYTKVFSLYLRIRNLTATKYEYWNYYPAHTFQFMAGFTYSL